MSRPEGVNVSLIPNTSGDIFVIQDQAPPGSAGPAVHRVWKPGRAADGAGGESQLSDDAELMAALNARNPLCLRSPISTLFGSVTLALAVRVLRDQSEAEEVMQEVFLYLYERAHLFDASKGSARNWIMCVAESRALDRKLYLARRGFYCGVRLRALHDELLSKSDLEFETNSRLNRERLERALKILPVMQRQTIECFYFDGLALREISDRLGEPLGNVRHHLYRGLARLRKSTILGNLQNSEFSH